MILFLYNYCIILPLFKIELKFVRAWKNLQGLRLFFSVKSLKGVNTWPR